MSRLPLTQGFITAIARGTRKPIETGKCQNQLHVRMVIEMEIEDNSFFSCKCRIVFILVHTTTMAYNILPGFLLPNKQHR